MFIATEYDTKIKDAWLMWNLLTEGKGGRAQTLRGHACMFVHTALQVPTKSAQEYVAPIGRIEEHYSLPVEVVALESETMSDISKASSKSAHAVTHGGASCLWSVSIYCTEYYLVALGDMDRPLKDFFHLQATPPRVRQKDEIKLRPADGAAEERRRFFR
jgi:hypothetical protein